MTSREPRFWLRFTSGEREGERVALAEEKNSVGRRSDNAVVIADSSVSGRHAEIRLELDGVQLIDVGSTNGTRLAGKKITEGSLRHGDEVQFGTILAIFEDDTQLAPQADADADADDDDEEISLEFDGEDDIVVDTGDASEPIPAAVPAARTLKSAAPGLAAAPARVAGDDDLRSVSAERINASGSRSKSGLLLFVLVLAAGGFAAWKFVPRGGSEGGLPAVVDVEGNELGNYSFEDPEAATWGAAEAGSQSFYVDTAFASSGALGLGCILADGEWAYARSEDVSLSVGRELELSGELFVDGGAVGRLGVELFSSDGSLTPFVAWAPSQAATDGFVPVELAFQTLPGYDRGRAVVAATSSGDGDVSFDDVSIVLESGGPAPIEFEEYELCVLGSPGSTAVLSRSGRVLLSSLALSAWSDQGLSGWSDASWTATANGTGFTLTASAPAPAGTTLHALTSGNRPFESSTDEILRLATIGPDGYRAHASSFERADATDILGGEGVNMIRIGLSAPVDVSFAVRDKSAHVRAGFSGLSELELQLTFRSERQEASQLARRARESENNEQYGSATEQWIELLERFPFEGDLIDEAQASQSRLSAMGYARIEEVSTEMERARFFQLVDIYTQCRESALAVATAFAGTETEDEALALIEAIDAEVAQLRAGGADEEVQRLTVVLKALLREASPGLRLHVDETLQGHRAAIEANTRKD